MTVHVAAQQVRDRKLTPLTLLERSLERIREVDPLLRAFVAINEDGVRDDAIELTREADAGRVRGPLHGVPIAVKDVIDVRGLPTRGGSAATESNAARADAPAVERLRAAGALIVGKVNTHEFAHGVTTPPTRNPWDPQRIPGGSSGGSAVAVASGQCLAALGSDTGGSIRVPAALCGVSGLRSLPRDIPVGGILPFSPRLDTCGPIARDALDLALMFEILSGTPCPIPGSAMGVRVGTVARAALGELDDEVGDAVEEAVHVLAAAGAGVVTADVPPFPAWSAPRAVYVLADFLDVHRNAGWYPQRLDRYGEELASYFANAERITPEARADAVRELEVLERRLRAGMADVDVLVLPTTPIAAPLVDDCVHRADDEGRAPIVGTLMRLCGPFSWCGLAAVTVPCGMTTDGLPIGVQIAGRDVSTVLNLAAAYQARTAHHLREPALLDIR
ncbi:amidase [Mycolicibacterium sp. YH-1]|uniref:amidase n=1 Tax=Mycolicibacterium sp. YH-1 TaxID=2908837 RepID=UPI001F4BCE22|nr:amidase [Mycolicibacterium sp. YH-1]UNB53276.1 amidase [Mycolicibacterium sp. YH-1]